MPPGLETGEREVVIVGAGPAGLTAALELSERGYRPLVIEATGKVGGLARTECHGGYRFDIGGHRYFTRDLTVQRRWEEMLGRDLLTVQRLSRIAFKGRFFSYPIEFRDVLGGLGAWESLAILASFVRAQLSPGGPEESFERWAIRRFGRRLYSIFFKGYTEKVWGIPCSRIRAEWAAQRIAGLSLRSAVANALFGTNGVTSLIREFRYPRLGSGMMWEAFAEAVIRGGGELMHHARVAALHRGARGITHLTVECDPTRLGVRGKEFISTMPLAELVLALVPPPPREVLDAAQHLAYRALVVVGLVVDCPAPFPDQWIYVQTSSLRVGRVQNFKSWSPEMAPVPARSSLGIEYFCNLGDELWSLADPELVALATRELSELDLVRPAEVLGGVVFRQSHAYPVYQEGDHEYLDIIREFLSTIPNLQTVGRCGMHRYHNIDHCMLTGLAAAATICGERGDPWSVNTNPSHIERLASHATSRGGRG